MNNNSNIKIKAIDNQLNIYVYKITPILLFSTGNDKKYFYIHENKTWRKAQDYCLRHNAILAEPKSAAESTKIKDLIWNNTDQSIDSPLDLVFHEGPWIGATYEVKDRQWVWAESNQTVNSKSYTDWGKDEPTGGKNGSCLRLASEMNYRRWEFKWSANYCEVPLPFVCQMK